jgi:hypothetical protein
MNTDNKTIAQQDDINPLAFQFTDKDEIIGIIRAETTLASGQADLCTKQPPVSILCRNLLESNGFLIFSHNAPVS